MNPSQELRIMEKLGAIETDTKLLRKELLGNGQPGRMKLAEDAIQKLQGESRFQDGVLYSVNAIIAIVIAVLVSHGSAIYHFFFPPKH